MNLTRRIITLTNNSKGQTVITDTAGQRVVLDTDGERALVAPVLAVKGTPIPAERSNSGKRMRYLA